MKAATATIVREYGPFAGVSKVNGVTFDGTSVWIATGITLEAIDPESGRQVRSLDVPAHAGTAFDGAHLYQIAGDRIQKVNPAKWSRRSRHRRAAPPAWPGPTAPA
jgi:hypothetical protein